MGRAQCPLQARYVYLDYYGWPYSKGRTQQEHMLLRLLFASILVLVVFAGEAMQIDGGEEGKAGEQCPCGPYQRPYCRKSSSSSSSSTTSSSSSSSSSLTDYCPQSTRHCHFKRDFKYAFTSPPTGTIITYEPVGQPLCPSQFFLWDGQEQLVCSRHGPSGRVEVGGGEHHLTMRFGAEEGPIGLRVTEVESRCPLDSRGPCYIFNEFYWVCICNIIM